MSLVELYLESIQGSYLLNENKIRKIIVDKIGLSDSQYKQIQKNVKKKYHIIVANILKSHFDLIEDEDNGYNNNELTVSSVIINRFNQLIELKNSTNNFPQIDLKKINQIGHINSILEKWNSIRDWANGVTPTPNLNTMEFEDAYEQSVEWHNSLTASDIASDVLEVAPDAEVIHTFPDGSKWIDLKQNDCKGLGHIMGHCASTDADTLLQYITSEGKFRVTAAYNYDHTYTQMKGVQNDKPDEKYYEYCEWLFSEEAGKYQIKSYLSEYQQGSDFTVKDFRDEDRAAELIEKYPELEGKDDVNKVIRLFDDEKYDQAINTIEEYTTSNVVGFGRDSENVYIEMDIDNYFEIFENSNYNGDINSFFANNRIKDELYEAVMSDSDDALMELFKENINEFILNDEENETLSSLNITYDKDKDKDLVIDDINSYFSEEQKEKIYNRLNSIYSIDVKKRYNLDKDGLLYILHKVLFSDKPNIGLELFDTQNQINVNGVKEFKEKMTELFEDSGLKEAKDILHKHSSVDDDTLCVDHYLDYGAAHYEDDNMASYIFGELDDINHIEQYQYVFENISIFEDEEDFIKKIQNSGNENHEDIDMGVNNIFKLNIYVLEYLMFHNNSINDIVYMGLDTLKRKLFEKRLLDQEDLEIRNKNQINLFNG